MHRATIPIEELADLKTSVNLVEASLVLSGKFDDKIKEFKAERAALHSAQSVVATVNEAAALRAQAVKETEEAKANASYLSIKAKALHDAAETRLVEAENKESDLAQREAALASRMTQVSDIAKQATAAQEAVAKKELDLERRAADLAGREAAAKAQEAALAKREQQLEAAKQALRAVV